MPIPDVSVTIRDGALGTVIPSTARAQAKLGCAALGAVNSLYTATDLNNLKAQLGPGGPLTEAAALALSTPNAGTPVYCVPLPASTPGTLSAVTKVGVGAGVVTLQAVPFQQLLVKIITGGAVSTATFKTSYDGGVTYQDLQTTAATVVLTNAPSITLAVVGGTGGSFVAGDIWTVSTTGTATLTGTGTGTVSVSVASPLDSYSGLITITTTGGRGAGYFTYSLDGGKTTSGTVLIPSSGNYPIPSTGVMAIFSASSFTTSDTHSFTATPPSYSSSELSAGIDALVAQPQTWGFLHAVGAASSVANAAALLATVDTKMTTAANNFRFAAAFVEVPTDTDANIIAAFIASASTRVGAGAGYETQVSPLTGYQLSRNSTWQLTARLGAIAPGTDAARVADGPLPGIISLVRDEQATPGLDAARFCTLRTIIGRTGFYVTNARMMAAAGSDFTFATNRRVMDVAAAGARLALLIYLNDSVRVSASTGKILEADAQAIEAFVGAQLRIVLTQPSPQLASDLSVVVDRNANILSTGILPVTVRVLPLGYNRSISLDIGFTNPALKLS